jgi:hypothetical protein
MSVPIKSLSLALTCGLASIALAACGGSGSKATATQDSEQQIVKFTRCLREHGVNVSTPNGAGGGPIRVQSTAPQAMEAAQKACQRYRPQGGKESLSPAERAAREDAVNKFAKCMREHGIEVQIPTRGTGGIGIQLKGQNPQSPAFQAAQKACEGLLPKLRPAGRTGGPRSGSGGPSTDSSGPSSGAPGGAALTLGAGK